MIFSDLSIWEKSTDKNKFRNLKEESTYPVNFLTIVAQHYVDDLPLIFGK